MADFLFRLMRVLIVLGVALGAAFFLFNAKQAPDRKEAVKTPPGVTVIPARSGPGTMAVDAFGTVEPRTKVNLAAEVAGRIDYIHPSFKEGEKIQKNDILITIDRRSFRLDREAAAVRVDQARADIRHLTREIENLKSDAGLARTNMDLSLKELERVRVLSSNQFASKNSLDKAEQQYLAARIQLQSVENRLALTPPQMARQRAALAMAENELAKADLVLEKSQIRAGFNGFVLSKQAEPGEYVNPGQVLGAVYESGGLDVEVGIPFEEVKWLKKAFEGGTMPRALVSIANLKEGGSPVWTARVARIKARIDEKTRTLPMTIEIGPPDTGTPEIENPLKWLKPGTFVKCRILGEVYPDVFRLPRHLVRSDNTLFTVKEGRLDIRRVFVLRKFEDQVFVNKGLDPGTLVITSPLPGAKAGMALTVKPKAD